MTMPPIKRLRELSVTALTEWEDDDESDDDDHDGFITHLLDLIRADGYEPTEEELAVVGRAMVRQVEREAARDEARDDARDEANRLLDEWRPYADQWDDWIGEAHEAEGVPIKITIEEDFVFIGETLMLTGAEFERVTAMFLALHDRIVKILVPFPELSVGRPEGAGEQVKQIRTLHTLTVEARVQWERRGRLAEKRKARENGPALSLEPRRCSVEGCTKPVAVNDELCKKHGREAGLVPRGKVEDVKLSKRERRRIEREETTDG